MNRFIFDQGIWIGEGKINLSFSQDYIPFYTKWTIAEEDECLKAVQIVELQGVKEHVVNTFIFYDIQDTSFALTLESVHTGRIVGKGTRKGSNVSWEFSGLPSFVGHEKFELQEDGNYKFFAQYGPLDSYHTNIEGIIKLKN